MKGEAHIILFDGDCGICSWCAEKGREIATEGQWRFEPYQTFSREELARFGLDYETCSQAVQLVTPEGDVFAAAGAVNYFLLRQPPYGAAIALLYLFPILLPIEALGYELVARHRTKISTMLGLDACKVDLG